MQLGRSACVVFKGCKAMKSRKILALASSRAILSANENSGANEENILTP